MTASDAARGLENAQMAVADTAAMFVDGDATIVELREAVADWRKAGQALHDAIRADANPDANPDVECMHERGKRCRHSECIARMQPHERT